MRERLQLQQPSSFVLFLFADRSAGGGTSLSQLPDVLVQSILQFLSARERIQTARCSSQSLHATNCAFAWLHSPPRVLCVRSTLVVPRSWFLQLTRYRGHWMCCELWVALLNIPLLSLLSCACSRAVSSPRPLAERVFGDACFGQLQSVKLDVTNGPILASILALPKLHTSHVVSVQRSLGFHRAVSVVDIIVVRRLPRWQVGGLVHETSVHRSSAPCTRGLESELGRNLFSQLFACSSQ